MFDLNPLNLPDAPLQQSTMLFVAGALGFIIGFVARKGKLAQMEAHLATTQRKIAECRRIPVGPTDQETLILRRVQARAGEVDLTRIGRVAASEADNLKQIVGIGPFLEKKLHAIGIYAFRQIANFTMDDVDKVNDIIEFFPGRIERDDWVGQAVDIERRKRM